MAEKPAGPVTSTAVVVVTTDNEQHAIEDGQLLQAEAVVVEEPDNAVRPDDKGVHFDENEPEEHDEPGEDERLVEESDDDPYLGSDSESEGEEVVKSKYHVEDGLFPIQQFKIYLFVMDDLMWSAIFLLCQIFFWVYGWPTYTEYGYMDWISPITVNDNPQGSITSGPSGSGVLPISTLMMLFGTIIWTVRFFLYDAQKNHPEIQVLGIGYLLNTAAGAEEEM